MSRKPPQNAIVFDLLGNARDSLRQAVELLALKEIGSNHARLKHAITCAAHCTELLLKEKLRRIDPALVWENSSQYPSLQGRTVSVATAIRRLKTMGKVAFEEGDEANLTSLRTTRNAIEHYEWRTSEMEARLIIGKALSFAVFFAKEQLGVDLSADFKKDDTWKMLLDELYEFVRLHGARVEASLLSRGEFPACCDECGELAVPFPSGSCELCGHWQRLEEDD
jgi:hypothetical protein